MGQHLGLVVAEQVLAEQVLAEYVGLVCWVDTGGIFCESGLLLVDVGLILMENVGL